MISKETWEEIGDIKIIRKIKYTKTKRRIQKSGEESVEEPVEEFY
jgi:hypothetical protein